MNSLARSKCDFPKCAIRLSSGLVAVAGLFFAIACNSSNSVTPPNSEGYGNGNLSGTYVFSSTGTDSNGYFLAFAGDFAANGSGGITGGMLDANSFDPGIPLSSIAITSGNYTVTSDGRGQATLNTSGGSITLDFVLTSSSHGLVTEFDEIGTGSGTIDLQNLGSLTGSYSFGFSGSTSAGGPIAMVGSFASGSSITGLADINSSGTALTDLTLSGTVTGGSPGTAALTPLGGNTYNFHVYMVDSTHLKFIETDTTQIMAGDAFTQQNSLPSGVYAYTMEGLDANSPAEPMALAGFFTSNGSSTISAGLEDYNDAGTLASTMPAVSGFGGSFTAFAGGRTQLTLNGIYNGVSGSNVTFAAYPSSGGVQLLEIDGAGITGGVALSQGSSALAAQGYGLNLSADNGGGYEEDDIAEFVLNSSNGFKGAEDINDQGSTKYGVAFNGTLAANSAAPGYGTTGTTSSQFNFNYYVANNGATTLILETDGDQLGVGSFEAQTSSPSPSAAAVSHFTPIHLEPSVKGAWKKRQP